MAKLSEEEKNEIALGNYIKAKVKQLTKKKFYGCLIINLRDGHLSTVKTEQIETMAEIRAAYESLPIN